MRKPLDPQPANDRFTVQATWTVSIRNRLLQECQLQEADRILEVGAGTGVIIASILDSYSVEAHALDIDPSMASFGKRNVTTAHWSIGDGHRLPYPDRSFNHVLCHFLLMWVRDPAETLGEMVRITVPNGMILCMAEPDYGGRVDYPASLEALGTLQERSLRDQGAETRLGRQLRALFHQVGLSQVKVGVLAGEWESTVEDRESQSEFQTLLSDLGSTQDERIPILLEVDQRSRRLGDRILFVPTFYASGRVI